MNSNEVTYQFSDQDPDDRDRDDDSAMYKRLSERVSAAAEDETLAEMFSGSLTKEDAHSMTGLVPKSQIELVREMVQPQEEEEEEEDGLLKWDSPRKKDVIDIDDETGKLLHTG